MVSEKQSGRGHLAIYLAGALFFLLVSFTFGYTHLYGDGIFWDGRVYAKALATWHGGGDPYAGSQNSLLFVSPPIFLYAAGMVSHLFPGHIGWYVYVAVVIAAMLSIPFLLARTYLGGDWMTPGVAMLLFALQPRFIVERSMDAGNMVIPMYALALWSGADGIKRNRWLGFLCVILIGSLSKPAFLALLLLPLLAGSGQWIQSITTVVAVGVGYALQRLTTPVLYQAFERAAYRQIFVKHDLGSGTYDWLYQASRRLPALRSIKVDSVIHLMLFLVIAGFFFSLRSFRESSRVARLWVPALFVVAVLANPRMQDYDSCLAIVPALFIWVENARSAFSRPLGIAMVAVGFNILIVLFTTNYEAGLGVLFVGSILLTILQALAEQRAPAHKTRHEQLVVSRL